MGFVSTGIRVIQFTRKTIKDIKDAPRQLQSLSDRVADIECSLDELQRIEVAGLFETTQDLERLARWTRNVSIELNSSRGRSNKLVMADNEK